MKRHRRDPRKCKLLVTPWAPIAIYQIFYPGELNYLVCMGIARICQSFKLKSKLEFSALNLPAFIVSCDCSAFQMDVILSEEGRQKEPQWKKKRREERTSSPTLLSFWTQLQPCWKYPIICVFEVPPGLGRELCEQCTCHMSMKTWVRIHTKTHVVPHTCNLGCPTGEWEAETGEPWQTFRLASLADSLATQKQKILSQKRRRQWVTLKPPGSQTLNWS